MGGSKNVVYIKTPRENLRENRNIDTSFSLA